MEDMIAALICEDSMALCLYKGHNLAVPAAGPAQCDLFRLTLPIFTCRRCNCLLRGENIAPVIKYYLCVTGFVAECVQAISQRHPL